MRRRAGGFSLIELLMAMAVMVTFGGALLSLILAGQSIARTHPDAADVQQRARVGLQILGAELARAGAGLDRGPLAGALAQYFPPIGPSTDGGLTLWYVAGRDAQATLAAPFAQGETDALVESGGNCPGSSPACAFTQASSVIVFDGHGCRDVLRVDAVTPTSLHVRPSVRACAYAQGAAIGAGEVRTYLVDPVARQLLRRDEATGLTVPVLDNVMAMTVEYPEGARRVRITLRFAPALARPLVPDLEIAYDVMPPNLQGPW